MAAYPLFITVTLIQHCPSYMKSRCLFSSSHRALIGNVITPQDIGVTYDMIGGLAEVRTLKNIVCVFMTYVRVYSMNNMF